MGGRRQFARRLVEADVTVAANAEQLESDPTRPLNRGLVTIALGLEIVRRAVDALNRRKMWLDYVDPEVEWIAAPHSLLASEESRGYDGIRRF